MTKSTINFKDFYFFDHIQQNNTALLKAFENQLIKLFWQIEGLIETQAQYGWVHYFQDCSHEFRDV